MFSSPRSVLTITLAATLLSTAAVASAQPGQPPPPPTAQPAYVVQPPSFGVVQRSGFLIGFSLGMGSFADGQCESNCDSLSGVALDIHLGGMLTPRLALMFDGSGVVHTLPNDATLTHVVDTVAAQYWVTPKIWIKGGLGIGQLSEQNSEGMTLHKSETGAAALIAAGIEVLQTRSFALDLQLRASSVTYDENDTISMGIATVGFNWY